MLNFYFSLLIVFIIGSAITNALILSKSHKVSNTKQFEKSLKSLQMSLENWPTGRSNPPTFRSITSPVLSTFERFFDEDDFLRNFQKANLMNRIARLPVGNIL